MEIFVIHYVDINKQIFRHTFLIVLGNMKGHNYHSTGLWFSLGTPTSFTNKTDRHDIIEILLKVALNTIDLHCNPQKITTTNGFW
jgi:hypothetical protein